jgi:moderate conductance mechanosensitive channel
MTLMANLGHLAPLAGGHPPPTLTGTCGGNPGLSCRTVWDLSHNVRAAQVTESYLSGPAHLLLRVAFVVLVALVIRTMLHRLINRVTERATQKLLPQFRSPLPARPLFTVRLIIVRLAPAWLTRRRRPARAAAGGDGAQAPTQLVTAVAAGAAAAGGADEEAAAGVEVAIVAERRHQRVHALGSILRSAASVTTISIAGVVVLGDLGINLAPLLASAGVVGIAIGFGAQNLVRDYLTGVFMLLEDQYGVGDVITVGDATGTVETMTLRITRIRDVNGVVWHIRNGTIDQVGNKTQGWARAIVDFPVPYAADLATIRAILAEVAEAAWADPAMRAIMLEKPDVWGAQAVSSTEVVMRVVARTAPLRQWETERELRARLKAALDAAGIKPEPDPARPDAPMHGSAEAPRRHRAARDS